MTDKQINTCEFLNICQTNCSGTLEDTEVCHYYELYKQLQRKEQECEHWKKVNDEKNELLANLGCPTTATARMQVLTLQQQINQLKEENEDLNRNIAEIFACLIKANRSGIITDTIWVGNITTLWDYIAQTLKIEGDQIQIEEQVFKKISECGVTK